MRTTIITATIILAIGAVAFFLSASGDADKDNNKVYDKIPAFTLSDYAGNEVSRSDFEGKILVVNSWAVWCPFCRDELADFALLQEEFGDSIVVVAIDRAESLQKAKEFTDSAGVTDKMIFLLDPSDSFYRSIGGFSMPETIFVDGSGNIRVHKRGPMKLSEMREKVLSIIDQNQ